MLVTSTRLAAFKTSKFGSKPSNCADSFAISPDGYRIAIADGVSKSYMPKFVADALTEYYVSDKFPDGPLFSDRNATELISYIVAEWDSKSNIFEASVDEDTAFDLVYQRELYGMGASTFAGICIGKEEFSFDVLGDSCIFIIPKDHSLSPIILSSMPCEVTLENETPFKCDFGIHPHFIDTKGRIVGEPLEGSVKAFDCTILLATDAFSDWFCRNYTKEDANHIIDTLKGIDSPEKFDSFIGNLRDRDLKNDDVAIVLVDVQVTAEESVSRANDDKYETESTTPEDTDDESTLNQVDAVETIIEDSNDLGEIAQPEEDVNTGNSQVDIEIVDESAPFVLMDNSEEAENSEFIDSETVEQIVEPNFEGEVDDSNGAEENIIDIADETNYEKSKIISIIKKCLGLS